MHAWGFAPSGGVLYSRACGYAMRALLYLASLDDERRATVREISQQEQLPQPGLAKVLQRLARADLVDSLKGPRGGFALKRTPDDITLFDVVYCIDGGFNEEGCAMGIGGCGHRRPCALHEQWKVLREAILDYLRTNTLATLQAARDEAALANAGIPVEGEGTLPASLVSAAL